MSHFSSEIWIKFHQRKAQVTSHFFTIQFEIIDETIYPTNIIMTFEVKLAVRLTVPVKPPISISLSF